MKKDENAAYPPETLEGWYALHQIFHSTPGGTARSAGLKEALSCNPGEGWSACVRLIGSRSDWMLVHFRKTLDDISAVQSRLSAHPTLGQLLLDYSFLSVTEAGLYHITAECAREAIARGGAPGDAEFLRAVSERAKVEARSPHVQKRLYPELPQGMPYVSFYPMSKRREAGQNWYTLSLDERSRLMHGHGMVGRRYAGKVVQVISGAIGFDAWEWGVTLFAADPLDFKKLVTDMRFDEASAKYADFGDFYVGKLTSSEEWGLK